MLGSGEAAGSVATRRPVRLPSAPHRFRFTATATCSTDDVFGSASTHGCGVSASQSSCRQSVRASFTLAYGSTYPSKRRRGTLAAQPNRARAERASEAVACATPDEVLAEKSSKSRTQYLDRRQR